MTVGESKAQRWQDLPRVTQLLVAKLDFLAAILALAQPFVVCWKLTAKPYVSRLPSHHCLALFKESSCLDLLWALGFVASLGTCLFIHFASKHLVSSWNVPGLVPVTELTAWNRTDAKFESWGGLWTSLEYGWVKYGEASAPLGLKKAPLGCSVWAETEGWVPDGNSVLDRCTVFYYICIIFKRGDICTGYKIPEI